MMGAAVVHDEDVSGFQMRLEFIFNKIHKSFSIYRTIIWIQLLHTRFLKCTNERNVASTLRRFSIVSSLIYGCPSAKGSHPKVCTCLIKIYTIFFSNQRKYVQELIAFGFAF